MDKALKLRGIFVSLVAAGMLAGCATNLQLGEQAGRAGDYKKMLEHCRMAAKEANPDPQAQKCIGDAQAKLGNRTAAEAAYLTYLDSIPDDTDVRMTLVKMYFDDGRYNAAQTHVEKVLQFDPANYEAHYLLGEIHRTNALCDSAKASYYRALEIHPDYFAADAGLEKLEKVCKPEPKPKKVYRPKVKKEKVFQGGGKALREGQW